MYYQQATDHAAFIENLPDLLEPNDLEPTEAERAEHWQRIEELRQRQALATRQTRLTHALQLVREVDRQRREQAANGYWIEDGEPI
ncbi:MAG: hypothetical protein JWP57_4035 [Spirosoma sp.]|nr:hypothetical protein [Spirosoma sp.]